MTTSRRPTEQEIAARAYQIYLERGRISGHDIDDWLQAEYELMQLPVRELAKLEPTPRPKDKRQKPQRSIVDLVRTAIY